MESQRSFPLDLIPNPHGFGPAAPAVVVVRDLPATSDPHLGRDSRLTGSRAVPESCTRAPYPPRRTFRPRSDLDHRASPYRKAFGVPDSLYSHLGCGHRWLHLRPKSLQSSSALWGRPTERLRRHRHGGRQRALRILRAPPPRLLSSALRQSVPDSAQPSLSCY